jgi:group I intron endonuclease
MKICGVYQILNNANGRCYIGQSCNIEGRLKVHFKALRKGCHGNPYLQSAFNKYGEHAFSTRTLTRCCPEYLTQVEQGWMERFKKNIYNLAPAAGSTLGVKWSDASREAAMGHPGHKFTVEQKARISAAGMGNKNCLGQKRSEEEKAAISARLIGNRYVRGRKLTAEHKAKISIGGKGLKRSKETKAKISATKIGNKNCLGQKRSEETKAKMRTTWAKRKEEKLCNTK